jgi:hypothetical protein
MKYSARTFTLELGIGTTCLPGVKNGCSFPHRFAIIPQQRTFAHRASHPKSALLKPEVISEHTLRIDGAALDVSTP